MLANFEKVAPKQSKRYISQEGPSLSNRGLGEPLGQGSQKVSFNFKEPKGSFQNLESLILQLHLNKVFFSLVFSAI